mgnify:CR=1 FL=1
MIKSSIQFINHASVFFEYQSVGILSDPWYEGDAFHKGWNLLVENNENDVLKVLEKTNYIWISHEHPDHFSIKFFLKYAELLKKKKILILFQETVDKRVKKFLESKKLAVRELPVNKKINLRDDINLICIKDGFYDSGLLIEAGGEKILNLNDCEINTQKRAKEVYKMTGSVDLLLTQFSYAAWKGGKSNIKWRQDAAAKKLETLELQIEIFKPKFLIPFASYIYFSNIKNFYLNDAANTPKKIIEEISLSNSKLIFLKPMDVFNWIYDKNQVHAAVDFWEAAFQNIHFTEKNCYEAIEISELKETYTKYLERLRNANNFILIKIIKALSPIKIFQPIVINLDDLDRRFILDLFSNDLHDTNLEADLCMSSESLLFLFKNSFGFDTLTVNGCMEEGKKGGFVMSTKTLALDNLNNLGINFSIKFLVSFKLIKIFLIRLFNVSKKIND